MSKDDEIRVIGDEDLKEYTLTIDAIADSAAGEFMFMPFDQFNAMIDMPDVL